MKKNNKFEKKIKNNYFSQTIQTGKGEKQQLKSKNEKPRAWKSNSIKLMKLNLMI
jgi:hypothetical protein